MTDQGVRSIWPERAPLIGMVHLLPLPGSPRWGGSMTAVLERARDDARVLTDAGYDGVVVENFSDVPFRGGSVSAETVAAVTAAVLAVRDVTVLPLGVNVLRNDAASSLSVAAVTGAHFIRVNIHTGAMWTDQGLLEGRAAETLRLRSSLGSNTAILADVHVKHATPPEGEDIGTAAADAWTRGLADGLIVSGTGTGRPTDLDEVARVRAAVPEATVFVGSGVSAESVKETLKRSDGVIVGSAIMRGGAAGAGIDPERASALVAGARG